MWAIAHATDSKLKKISFQCAPMGTNHENVQPNPQATLPPGSFRGVLVTLQLVLDGSWLRRGWLGAGGGGLCTGGKGGFAAAVGCITALAGDFVDMYAGGLQPPLKGLTQAGTLGKGRQQGGVQAGGLGLCAGHHRGGTERGAWGRNSGSRFRDWGIGRRAETYRYVRGACGGSRSTSSARRRITSRVCWARSTMNSSESANEG